MSLRHEMGKRLAVRDCYAQVKAIRRLMLQLQDDLAVVDMEGRLHQAQEKLAAMSEVGGGAVSRAERQTTRGIYLVVYLVVSPQSHRIVVRSVVTQTIHGVYDGGEWDDDGRLPDDVKAFAEGFAEGCDS